MNRERTGPTGHIHADIGIIFFSLTRELFFLQKQQRFFCTWYNISSLPEQLFRKKNYIRKKIYILCTL